MKFFIFLAAILGFSSAAPSNRGLTDDLDALYRLIPIDDYFEIARQFLIDPEIQEVVTFLQGDEWAGLVERISQNPTWIAFKDWANTKELPIDFLVSLVHEIIAITEIPDEVADLGGARAFVDAILAITPTEELDNLATELLETSADFQELFVILRGEDTRELFEWVLNDPTSQQIGERLREMGIDVDAVIDAIWSFLGWTKE